MGIPAPIGVSAAGQPNLGDQANAVLSGSLSAVGPSAPFAFRGPMNLSIWADVATSLATTAGSLTATVGSATGLAIGNAVNSVNVPPGTTIGGLSSTTATLAPPPVTLSCYIRTDGQVQTPAGFNTSALLGATVTVPSTAAQTTIPANTVVSSIIQASVAPTQNSPGTPGIVQLSADPSVVPPNTQPAMAPISAQIPGPVLLQFAVNGNAILVSGTDANATFTGAAIGWHGTLNLERSFDGGATFIVCNIGTAGALAQWTGSSVTPISITFGEPEKNVLYRFNMIAYTSGAPNYRVSQTGGAAESLAIGPLSGG
jgi:hypothetical protein